MISTKSLRLTHPARLVVMGTLAGVLLAAGCGPRSAPTATPSAASRPAARMVSAEPVRRGDIEQALSYNGDIRARAQITVLPRASGRVEHLLVDVGSRVKTGDVLAELEADSAAIQVLQARAALAGAEAKLAQVQAGARAEDVAIAEAALAAQQAGFEAAQARLEAQEQGGRPESVAQAEAAVTVAQARLALAKKGATQDVRQAAQSAVDSDKAALASAEAALASLAGTAAADLQAAQSQVDSLKAQVAAAEVALQNIQTVEGAASAQRDAAQATLDQAYQPTAADVTAAEAAVQSANATLNQARSQREATYAGSTGTACFSSATVTRSEEACNAAKAAADHAVDAAEKNVAVAEARLAFLRKGGTLAQQAQVTAALAQAEAGLKNTQTQQANLEGALVQVRENLQVAEARLVAIKNGTLEAQRAAAQSQVVAARERLRSDQARLEQLTQGPQPEEIQQAEAAVQQAEQQLALASMPASEQDLRALRAQVEQAGQGVAQARAQLDKVRSPFTRYDVEAAQAGADQARAQLELAQQGVRETRVVAPVEGVVGERMVSPGALVSPSTPLVTLVPPALELVVNVEEAQLGRIAEGQPVALRVAAYPDETFAGTVMAIAPIVDPKSRTASIRIEPRDEQGKLRPGMFARLGITTAAKRDTLLVPRAAVMEDGAGAEATVATIEEGDRVRKVPVQIGLITEQLAEILGGLSEGQLVATSGLANLSDGDLVAAEVETRTSLSQERSAGL